MKLNMSTLLILIQEPEESRSTLDGITAAICPILGTFGEQAAITSTEFVRELRNGEEGAPVRVLHVSLAGTANADFQTVVLRLARFLKQAAKDADIEARFELYGVIEVHANSASDKSTG
jgi:hypothetical protein